MRLHKPLLAMSSVDIIVWVLYNNSRIPSVIWLQFNVFCIDWVFIEHCPAGACLTLTKHRPI